jgi:hypothetical protein
MYRTAGIEAYPVLVRSRDGFFPEKVPSMSAFDHLIVAVKRTDGALVFTDPTDTDLAFGTISDHLAGKNAVIVQGAASRLITIPVPPPEQNLVRIRWQLREPRDAELSIEVAGESSRAWRTELRSDAHATVNSETLAGYLAAWPGTSVKSTTSSVTEERIRIRASVETQELSWREKDQRIVPLSRFFPRSIFVGAPRDEEIVVSVAIAGGARAEHLPEPRKIEAAGVELAIEAKAEARQVHVACRVRIKTHSPGATTPAEIQDAIASLSSDAIVIRGGAP